MSTTSIEWTEKVWNPVRGCALVSAGCKNCYAMRQAHRFSGAGQPYEGLTELGPNGPRWTGAARPAPEMLDAPLRWRKPARIFVNSMSDLFHEEVPDEFIDRVFGVMAVAQQHTFQVLTKRPERMLRYFTAKLPLVTRADEVAHFGSHVANIVWDSRGSDPANYRDVAGGPRTAAQVAHRRAWPGWPLPNVWLGVSVEDQAAADERIPLLLQTPAAVRWLSCEPLLGPVDIGRYFEYETDNNGPILPGIDWVVAGGESGPGARPMHPDWARGLRDQCQAAGVPFFFKQWGEWAPAKLRHSQGCVDHTNGRYHFDFDPACRGELKRLGKKESGRLLDGREWNEYPAAAEPTAPRSAKSNSQPTTEGA